MSVSYTHLGASVDLLENKIVLIVPAGKENGYTSFEDIVNAPFCITPVLLLSVKPKVHL